MLVQKTASLPLGNNPTEERAFGLALVDTVMGMRDPEKYRLDVGEELPTHGLENVLMYPEDDALRETLFIKYAKKFIDIGLYEKFGVNIQDILKMPRYRVDQLISIASTANEKLIAENYKSEQMIKETERKLKEAQKRV